MKPARILITGNNNALPRLQVYDCMAERWVAGGPSRTTRDAGAAAELRQLRPTHTSSGLFTPQPARPAANPKSAAGHFQAAFIDFLITMLGLTTFGAIAAFLLVLS